MAEIVRPVDAYVLSVVAVGALTVGWLLWDRQARPPRFAPVPARVAWMIDPLSWAYLDLSRGGLSVAVACAYGRLTEPLHERYGLTDAHILQRRRFRGAGERPLVHEAKGIARQLASAYRLAVQAEDASRNDWWSSYRRVHWQEKSEELFATILPEWSRVTLQLEAAA